MSVLIAAVTGVVSTPVPTPSPEIITKVVTQTVTPEWIKQVLELLTFVVPAWIASFAHSLLKSRVGLLRQDNYDWLNSALLFAYSAGTALLVLALEHKLSWGSPDQLAAAFLTVLGAASVRYNVLKLKQDNPVTLPATTVDPGVLQPGV